MNLLSPNFSIEELTFSQTASRNNLDNTPTPDIVNNLTLLCINVLEPLRELKGAIRVTSGYRSPAVNKLVGGQSNSQHCVGQASDILFPVSGMTLEELWKWIPTTNIEYDQLIFEYNSWLHLSLNAGNNRRTSLRIGC